MVATASSHMPLVDGLDVQLLWLFLLLRAAARRDEGFAGGFAYVLVKVAAQCAGCGVAGAG
jgi:hypothetical protein